jgi:hypothetical protein
VATTEYPTPAYPATRLRRAQVVISGVTSTWTDTGVVLLPSDAGLAVLASGVIKFGNLGGGYWAYPEGAYAADTNRPPTGGFPQTYRYEPDAVFRGGWGGAPVLVNPDLPDFCLALALYPDGAGSPPANGTYRGALRPNRGTRWGPEVIPQAPTRVWAIFNDQVGQFGVDNSGSFTLYLSIGGDPSEY